MPVCADRSSAGGDMTYGSADTDSGSLLDPLVTLPSEEIWPDKLKEFGICLDY